tara:strand:+ start:8232 stop:8438 length:207 start_codon:yes stop_codon:yes gene_type:complete
MTNIKQKAKNKIDSNILNFGIKINKLFKNRHNSLDNLNTKQRTLGILHYVNELRVWKYYDFIGRSNWK